MVNEYDKYIINIGICDDDDKMRIKIREMCEGYLQSENKEYNLIEFSSGEEVLAYSGDRIHLLFLDIEMGNIDGLEVMHNLLIKDTVWKIVFVSNHQDAVWKAFEMKTLGFIRKSVEEDMIIRYLSIILNELDDNISIIVKDNNVLKTIVEQDLLFLAAYNSYTDICTYKEKITLVGNIKYWAEQLNAFHLVRIHKSYVVNMYNINKFFSEKVILKNGDELPIGRKYKDMAEKKYTDYIMKKVQMR